MSNRELNEYNRSKSPLHCKSYSFAVRTVNMARHIVEHRKEHIIVKQVIRSGTAIGALIREAEFAQSPQDFANKLSIALKEANETFYWLNILKDTGYLETNEFESMVEDCDELIALLVSSIKTIKSRNNHKKGRIEDGE